MNHYHITTTEHPTTVATYEHTAMKQDKRVLLLLMEIKEATPSEIHSAFPVDVPITSIRRALTNLTKRGFAAKTEEVRKGMYGRNEHVWKYIESK